MSHNFEDLTRTTRKFTLKPDWAKEPERDFGFSREISQFVNTVPEMYSLSSAIAHRVKYGFTNLRKSDEKYLLDFFADCQGRLVRFWLPMWENAFRLAQDISIFDEYILVENVGAFNSFAGHERIFIETTGGDIITRHVTLAAGTESAAFETWQIETPFDRNLSQSEIRFFGRYILGRFDAVELQLSHITSRASQCEIEFVELPHEYVGESYES